MTGLSTKNPHGVYADTELLTLPMPRKNWRGCPLAEISLARTAAGWRSAIAFQFMTGFGQCSPITDRDPAFTVRDEAIAHAAAKMRACIDERESPDARLILAWLANLQPMQGDLFACLAA